MKTHLNFGTGDLGRSIAFYSMLLDAEPAKRYDDYALFITERPGLELALHPAEAIFLPSDTHYGIAVETVEEVDRAIARLEGAGLAPLVEREQTCCYAKQSKVWTSDPSGRRWEIYAVHEETTARDSRDSTCCAEQPGDESCCA